MEGDNAATAMKSVVADPHAYDWEGDTPLKRPCSRTIIYEMHVRGGLRRWIDTELVRDMKSSSGTQRRRFRLEPMVPGRTRWWY